VAACCAEKHFHFKAEAKRVSITANQPTCSEYELPHVDWQHAVMELVGVTLSHRLAFWISKSKDFSQLRILDGALESIMAKRRRLTS
jgi:hypothetical protein